LPNALGQSWYVTLSLRKRRPSELTTSAPGMPAVVIWPTISPSRVTAGSNMAACPQ
jgi:hypothetical protein